MASIEIIGFGHPPVELALKQTRQWPSKQVGELRVIEINMESPEAVARLKALGLNGHFPVVILIEGQHRFTNRDGSFVEFVGFQCGLGVPGGAKSKRSAADIETAVAAKC